MSRSNGGEASDRRADELGGATEGLGAGGVSGPSPDEAADGGRVEVEDFEKRENLDGEPSAAQLVKERAIRSGGG